MISAPKGSIAPKKINSITLLIIFDELKVEQDLDCLSYDDVGARYDDKKGNKNSYAVEVIIEVHLR